MLHYDTLHSQLYSSPQVRAGVQTGRGRALLPPAVRQLWRTKMPKAGCPLQWHPVWWDAAWIQQQNPASQLGTDIPNDLPVTNVQIHPFTNTSFCCELNTLSKFLILKVFFLAFYISLKRDFFSFVLLFVHKHNNVVGSHILTCTQYLSEQPVTARENNSTKWVKTKHMFLIAPNGIWS